MQVHLPPILFYALGAVLMTFGALRAYFLGIKPRRDESSAEGEVDPARSAESKRHVTFGLIWIAMGIVLIVSTAINVRR
jgi:hypothetical protein